MLCLAWCNKRGNGINHSVGIKNIMFGFSLPLERCFQAGILPNCKNKNSFPEGEAGMNHSISYLKWIDRYTPYMK